MQAELIVSIIFGSLSVLLAIFAIFAAVLISKRTDNLIQTEDSRAKQLIDDGAKRTQQMIDDGAKRAQEMMNQSDKEFRAILIKMDERTARINEMVAKMDIRHQVSGVREKGEDYKPE